MHTCHIKDHLTKHVGVLQRYQRLSRVFCMMLQYILDGSLAPKVIPSEQQSCKQPPNMLELHPGVCTCPAGYQHVLGKGGKVRRVLANRQSAQRSRIRKLQHISELEVTLEALQDDLFKLNPQLSKLEAKQAGKASVQTCWKKLYLQSVRQITIQRALNSLGDSGPLPALPVTSTSTPYDAQTFICTCDGSRERLTKRKTLSKSDDTLNPKL